MKAEQTKTAKRARELKVTEMMLQEPRIEAPLLVLAGDHDVIDDEHTLEQGSSAVAEKPRPGAGIDSAVRRR
jgi:hypothetical protein